jgi:hypothetical protein
MSVTIGVQRDGLGADADAEADLGAGRVMIWPSPTTHELFASGPVT